jgi:hypothetical protein
MRHNLYSSSNIIRVIKLLTVRVADHVARLEKMKNAYKMLFEKAEVKRPLG